ncbi:predicted protein [Naegleria gruberi]|uniref:Predicted protein n=1 Tax=Naegleria gruberi TaxID=5762 RepID=D2VNT5_NAEGR|nr:uncharacterized protein NAEGRDRAFT_70612 [Naegleria gruberi]EFC41470.1 predicted protein [Naegleria gruberi]|eukprot:XP_002674214.1 predicted protein [Naegleria gruberi strain NEG-M]
MKKLTKSIFANNKKLFSNQIRFVRTELVTENAERYEKEVQKTLKGDVAKTFADFDGWNETVGSSSEAIIKAERSEQVKNAPIEELQKQTIEILHEREEKKQFPFDQ